MHLSAAGLVKALIDEASRYGRSSGPVISATVEMHAERTRQLRSTLLARLERAESHRAALLAVCERIANLTDGTYDERDRLANLESIGEQARAAIELAKGD